jgi:hypothetical protein
VASAFKSSGLQLSVCLSDGMSTLDSSCAATGQGTSGGGGEIERMGIAPLFCDMPEKLRRILIGSATFAVDACVGDEYVGGTL